MRTPKNVYYPEIGEAEWDRKSTAELPRDTGNEGLNAALIESDSKM